MSKPPQKTSEYFITIQGERRSCQGEVGELVNPIRDAWIGRGEIHGRTSKILATWQIDSYPRQADAYLCLKRAIYRRFEHKIGRISCPTFRGKVMVFPTQWEAQGLLRSARDSKACDRIVQRRCYDGECRSPYYPQPRC